MAKRMVSILFLLYVGAFVFGGDAASFADIGFSPDGKTYVFGQYGKTDKKFQAYAEIYAVDVEKNDFIPGNVFISAPSGSSGSKSSFDLFEEFKQKNASALNKYNCTPVPLSNVLYIRENEAKPPADTLYFEDFERITSSVPVVYEVQLVPAVTGSGKTVRSSFDIIVAIKDPAGNQIEQFHVGNPQITRQGVSGYAISHIFAGQGGKSLVFVVEKTIADDTGISIRYMVETVLRK